MNESGLRKGRTLRHVLLWSLLLATSNLMWAQSGRGSLAGTVRDSSGAEIVQARVTLTMIDTQTVFQTDTNSEGLYVFPQIQVGRYRLAVSLQGFQDYVQEGITISVGSRATVDINLQVGHAAESIAIHADASQLQTESSDVGTTVPSTLLEALPLNFGGLIRSSIAFTSLTPGFAGDTSGNPGVQKGFKLNGSPTGSTDVLLDGASVLFASPNLQTNYAMSTDAVSEFKVQTSTFSAEFGRVGGGLVNLASKSGTNQIHGAVYDLLKNNVFDSNGWYNNHFGNSKPYDTQNDFGGFAGGSVRLPWIYDGRNKTFWFFSYEGFRFKSGGEGTASLATPAMWQGDFSSILHTQTINGVTYAGRQIYDYTTCSGANLGKPCEPFPNNQIPTSRLDPMSKAAISLLLPAPQNDKQPYQNTKYVTINPVNNDLYSFKIDHNLGTNQRLSGSYWVAKMPILVENPTYGSLYTNDFGGTNSHYVRLAHDYTIKPTLLNHLNFGFSRRFRVEVSPNTLGSWADKLNWHGGLVDKVVPWFDIQNGQGGGLPWAPPNDSAFADNTYQFGEDLFWTHGKHSFKFGVEHRRQEFNVRFFSNSNGVFHYGDVLTSAGNDANGNPIDPNSGFGAASFFLGAISSGNIPGGQGVGMRAVYYGFYGQDDWKLTNKLTLNLGMRYEVPKPVYETLERTSQVNPTLPNPDAGGLPGALEYQGSGTGRDGQRSPQSTYMKSFGPRAGLAYQLDPRTAVRVAYGIYYEALKVSNFANTDSAGFFALNYTFPTQTNLQTPAAIPSQISKYPGPLPPFINPSGENGQSPVFVDSKVARPGEIQNWTVDIQRQLPGQWIVDAAYVGAHGAHLQALMHDPNVAPISAMSRGACLSVLVTQQASNPACAGQTPVSIPYTNFLSDFGDRATVAQALRPFPQYGDANLDTALNGQPYGNYTYEALQAQINKRFGSGFAMLANYTWSKALTDADSDYAPQGGWNGANNGMINPYNPQGEKSYSNFDQPQILKVAYTYELPFGRGKKFANQSALADAVIGGWTISNINQYSSGTPLWVRESGWTSGIFAGEATASNLGDGLNARPNVVSGASPSGFHGGKWVFGQSRKFNAAAFSTAPSYTFGNAPRVLGNVRNFANRNEDIAVSKRFPLGREGMNFIFRFDAFNVFNRHTWNGFDNTLGDENFGQSTGASGNRTMQANFRITF
jgi:Carboxypeptidase regulatory-like domain/TonB dependent receptor